MKPAYLVHLAALALTFSSCKKETHAPITPVGTADLQMKISLINDHSHVDLDQAFIDGAGNSIQFTSLKFFVGHVHIKGHENDLIAAYHDHFLFDGSATNIFHLGQIPVEHIHELHFNLGLDEEDCMQDPATAGAPFNAQGMHFGEMGYCFLNMEGRVDTNGDGLFSEEDQTFQLHCGSPEMLRQLMLNVHQDLVAGSTTTLSLEMDIEELLSSIDLLNNSIHMGGGEFGAQLMDNLSAAIGTHDH
jgi:hypothetical protein